MMGLTDMKDMTIIMGITVRTGHTDIIIMRPD